MAKEAPATGSNRLATSTSATCAQESRSSRLTWPGSEMRAATALTANEASGRCSVTSASISCCDRPRAAAADGRSGAGRAGAVALLWSCSGRSRRGRSAARARAGLTSFFSADPGALRTALGRFPRRLECRLVGFGLRPCDGVPMAGRRRSAGSSRDGRPARCGARRRKGGGHVDYQHLSTLLWREQELLDLLLFKAEEKQYLILTGKTRWLARIAHEIEVVLDQLRTLEVERAAATEAIAVTLGLGANPSLRQVADAAPAPWNDLFAKHHEALLVLVTDLRSLSDANRELIEGGLAAIGDALLSVKTPARPAPTARPAAPTTARTAPSRWTGRSDEHLLRPERGDDRPLGAAAGAGRHRPEHRQRQHRGLLPPAGRPAGASAAASSPPSSPPAPASAAASAPTTSPASATPSWRAAGTPSTPTAPG